MTSLKWLETNNLFNNLIQRNQSAAFSSGKVRPNHERSEERFSRNAETDLVCRLLLEKKKTTRPPSLTSAHARSATGSAARAAAGSTRRSTTRHADSSPYAL